MTAIESINHFVDVMLESKVKFQDIKAETDRLNEALRECISRFKAGIDSIISTGVNLSDSELKEISQRQISELKILLERLAASLESTRKGMKFIREYEDSFNIAVFGKVKAGKSYTGNFIMGNVIRDMGIHTSYDRTERPKVEVYDRGKKTTQSRLSEFDEEGKEGFRVDPNEATSTIQLFRLGGMVWIDTPGIGSVTWENERLAKDYVDNADLIVYVSISDAGGTKQDFAEMKELHAKGKRFLLLLTQSDTVNEYVDENGNIISVLAPKSEKDRQSMEDYICETLTENGINNLDRGREILTISTKLALEGLKNNDEAMFDASNLKRFLEVLVSITQNDSARLKLATPSQRINAAINEIMKVLREADSKLGEHMKSLEDTKKRLSERNDYLQSKMLNECMTGITEIISRKANEIESGGSGVSASVLQDIIGNEIYRVIMKTCAEEFSGSESILSSYSDSLKIEGIKDMAMRRDTITYTYKDIDYVERAPQGFFEHIGYLFGKTYYRPKITPIHETRSVNLGVNLQEVMRDVRAGIDSIFADKVPEIMKKIADDFIAPIAHVRENARRQIEITVRELESLKIKI